MAITYVDDTADAGQTEFLFNFPYLEDEHVAVFIDDVRQTIGSGEDYTVQTSPSKRIVLNVAATGGELVRVRRISDPANDLVDFQNGSVLTESELDRSYLHNRYLAEESAEQNDISLRLKAGVDGWEGLNKKILNIVDPTSDQDAATKNYVDETVAGVALGTVPDGSITAAKLDTDAVTTAKIEDNAVTSAKISDTDDTFKIDSSSVVINEGGAAKDFRVEGDANANLINTDAANNIVGVGMVPDATDLVGGKTYKAQVQDAVRVVNETGTAKLKLLTNKTGGGSASITLKSTTPPAANEGNYSIFTGSANGKFNIINEDTSNGVILDNTGSLDISGSYKVGGNNLLLDEDTMSSDSDTQGATQQSIKAYVDSRVMSKYASAWFNDTTGLANGGTYTFTHNLGTAEAQVEIWMATSSGGADIKLVTLDTDSANVRGASITAISTTSLTVQLTSDGWVHLNSDGSRSTGSWGTTYTHIKVVAIG